MKIWNIGAKKVEEVKPEYGVRLMEQGKARKATAEEAAAYEAKIAGAVKSAKKTEVETAAKAAGAVKTEEKTEVGTEAATSKKGVKKA